MTFLVLGIVLVVVDGQLIYRGGKGYLKRAAYDEEQAGSMMKLTTVLFHLVVLGLVEAPSEGGAARARRSSPRFVARGKSSGKRGSIPNSPCRDPYIALDVTSRTFARDPGTT